MAKEQINTRVAAGFLHEGEVLRVELQQRVAERVAGEEACRRPDADRGRARKLIRVIILFQHASEHVRHKAASKRASERARASARKRRRGAPRSRLAQSRGMHIEMFREPEPSSLNLQLTQRARDHETLQQSYTQLASELERSREQHKSQTSFIGEYRRTLPSSLTQSRHPQNRCVRIATRWSSNSSAPNPACASSTCCARATMVWSASWSACTRTISNSTRTLVSLV